MYPVKPAVLAFSQPVAAICVSVNQASQAEVFVVESAIAENSELAVTPDTPSLGASEKNPQQIWQERATVSRAYAKILLQGGSLG